MQLECTMQRLLSLILFLVTTTAFGQKKNELLYVGGNAENLPNVQLYLKKDSTYDLKLFRKSCWKWEFLKGKYYYNNDSLVLEYETFHPESLCQIIDTFHRQRTLKLLYTNDNEKIVDKLSIHLDHDTTNVDHFPLSYIDTAIVNRYGSSITYTYYAPYFTTKVQSARFFKPKRKLDQIYLIKLKVENNFLVPGNKFSQLFAPFESLSLQ